MNRASHTWSLILLCPLFLTVARSGWAQEKVNAVDPADVTAAGREPVVFKNGKEWVGIPAVLEGSQIYSAAAKTPTAKSDAKPNEVSFEVKSSGVVLLVASWEYDGYIGGGWYEERTTHAKMAKAGWVRLARLTHIAGRKRDAHFLYRKQVKAGESFRFHTRKVNPPLVVVPNRKQAKAALVMKEWSDQGHPPTDRTVSTAAGKLAAVVDVTAYTATELKSGKRWNNVPDFISGALIYDRATKRRPVTSLATAREVEFTAKSDGVIGLAATWAPDGFAVGDWPERRKTAEQLVELGWVRFGTMTNVLSPTRPQTYELFYRVVLKGDTIRFHTRKRLPPYVIVFRQDQLDAIGEKNVPLHRVESLAATRSDTSKSARAIKPTVMLTTLETTSTRNGVNRGMLIREIPRQAVLIAARDGLGAATRDRSLREAFPEEGQGAFVPFEMMSSVTDAGDVQLTLFRRQDDTVDVLWDRVDTLPPGEALIPRLVSFVEPLSRTVLRQTLERVGVKGASRKRHESGAVPGKIAKLQQHLGIFTQYEAVRRLHELMQTEGESPERVAALARGYAHLGTLTEAMYSPMHKVFKARALLYAERLQSSTSSSSWALMQRAYVRAFVGLHRLALDDLKQAEGKPASGAPFDRPNWVTMIEDFCTYDIAGLKKAATAGPTRPLARYLIFMTVELSGMSESTLSACNAVLEDHPDCYRAIRPMYRLRSPDGAGHAVERGPQHLALTLRDRVLAVPNLADDIRNDLESMRGGNNVPEMVLRAELIRSLKNVAPKSAANEPSLALLGQMIEELTFAQAEIHLSHVRRDAAQNYVLNLVGKSNNKILENYEIVTENHVYGAYLKRYHTDRQARMQGIVKLIASLNTVESQVTDTLMYDYLRWAQPAAWKKLGQKVQETGLQHSDEIYRDLILKFDSRWGVAINGPISRRLAKVSPGLPLTVRYQITYDWAESRLQAAEWEKRFGENPLVMITLGEVYFKAKKYADAERCFRKIIDVSRERLPYHRLAGIYREQHRTEEWVQMLNRLLEFPGRGYENAQIRNALAQHYLKKKEYETAREYADVAAKSGAAWAWLTSGEIYTALGDYLKAEQYLNATSTKYRDQRLAWFYWCHRTGRGNVDAATKLAYKHLESLGTKARTTDLQHIGAYYLLVDDEDKALQVYQAAFSRGRNSEDAALAIVLADKLGKHELRDQLLKRLEGAKLMTVPSAQGPVLQFHGRPVRHLMRIMQTALRDAENVQLDIAQVEELLKKVPEGSATNLMYLTGRFLLQHDQTEAGIQYLQRAASGPFNRRTRILARHALRKLTIEIDPERDEEVENRRQGLVQVIIPKEFQQKP